MGLLNFDSLTIEVCHDGCSKQEVHSTFFTWGSLTFLPQEGHPKHRMPLIFPCSYFVLQGKFLFFTHLFTNWENTQNLSTLFWSTTRKRNGNPVVILKAQVFLAFANMKWSHSILGTFTHYTHIPLLSKVFPFKKNAIIYIMLHLKMSTVNDPLNYF